MSLPESLEQAAAALTGDADAIRPANGDPHQLLASLDSEAATRVLGWLLSNAPDAGAELAGEWLDDDAGREAVAAQDEAALPKAGRKALRRVIHNARSRGIEVVSTAPATEKVGRLPDLDEAISAAYVSPLDPRGSRLVYLVESSPSGGARVFETLLDRDRGVVDFQIYKAGRRQVRDFIRDVTGRKGGFAAVEAEPGAVRALIAGAVASHPADRPFPKPFGEWRARVLRDAEGEATPGERVRAELGDASDDDALTALADIALARGIGPWPPSPAAMEAAVAELRSRAEEGGEDVTDQLGDWVKESIRSLYEGEFAEANAERLEESAYIYWRRGDESTARACLASATRAREGSAGEAPVIRALADVVAEALTTDLKQSLGLAGDAEPAPAED